ncbi:hypothetical protein [Urechidicola sp. KH5]
MRKKSFNQISGISNAKRKISKKTGVPLTKSGRKQKLKRASKGGCLLNLTILFVLTILLVLA